MSSAEPTWNDMTTAQRIERIREGNEGSVQPCEKARFLINTIDARDAQIAALRDELGEVALARDSIDADLGKCTSLWSRALKERDKALAEVERLRVLLARSQSYVEHGTTEDFGDKLLDDIEKALSEGGSDDK